MTELTKKLLKEQYKNRTCIGGIYRIKCVKNTKQWLRSTIDLKGAKNRFDFSVSVNSCPDLYITEDWNRYGSSSFVFETIEEITKEITQSDREFADDVDILFEIWTEKLNA